MYSAERWSKLVFSLHWLITSLPERNTRLKFKSQTGEGVCLQICGHYCTYSLLVKYSGCQSCSPCLNNHIILLAHHNCQSDASGDSVNMF